MEMIMFIRFFMGSNFVFDCKSIVAAWKWCGHSDSLY